jgi:translation initiation factor IF-2
MIDKRKDNTANTSTKEEIPLKEVKIPSTVTVKKFAKILDVPATELITELMKNGIMATINEEVDFDTAAIISEDMGYLATEDLEIADDEMLTLEKVLDICEKEKKSDKKLINRPPIVTILGHVDHGKTTLLDTLRKASVASRESGGITQHISAYQTKKRGKLITFIDTPGHEAFAAMRERGVSIADIAVLVVAADDGVRPQTKEVIKYLKEKNIPTIVAINKIDKPNANPTRVKQELAEHEVMIEEWGGKVMCNEISAKNNIGVTDILESILLLAEVEDFKADASRDGLAIVLESHKDPQKGPVATAVVKTGTLKVGQDVNVGKTYGRIRHMENHHGESIEKALPSTPVTIFGLADTAETNDVVQVANAKRSARLKSQEVAAKLTGDKKQVKSITDNDGIPKLNIIVKSDVQGSIEAIEQILGTISQEKVSVTYIDTGVGNVTESDIRLASSSDAIIYGFNVSVSPVAKRMADDDEVTVLTYKVIYELVDDIKERLLAMLPDEIERTDIGELEVLGIFFTEKDKMIIGGKITQGKVIAKDVKIDIFRKENRIGTGNLINLQHNKVDIDEVKKGQECGITFKGETKIKTGDKLHMYTEVLKDKEL